MERRFILFLVVSFLAMMVYTTLLKQLRGPVPQAPAAAKAEKPKPKPEGKAAAEKEKPAEKPEEQKPAAEAPPPKEKAAEAPAEAAAALQWITLGSLDPNSPYRMLVTLTNQGAAIARIELNSPRYCNIDDRSGYLGYVVMDRNAKGEGCPVQVVGPGTPADRAGLQAGDLIKAIDGRPVNSASALETALEKTWPEQKVSLTIARNGKEQVLQAVLRRRPLELVQPEGSDPLSMLLTLEQLGEEQIKDDGKNPEANLDRELKGVSLRKSNWQVVRTSPEEVVFSRTLPQAEMEIFKTYKVAKVPLESAKDPDFKAYHLEIEIKIVNRGQESRKVAYRLDGPTGLVMEGKWYANKVGRNWGGTGLRDYLSRIEGEDPAMISCTTVAEDKSGPPAEEPMIDYLGIDAQYFSAMLIPQKKERGEIWFATAQPLCVGPVNKDHYNYTDISFRVSSLVQDLQPGASFSQNFQLFAGPKKPSLLANYGLDGCVYYGWFGWVAKPMLSILHAFYLFIPNYGLAIILLTVLVRSCMFPLSIRQALGAQKMQLIQPEMKKIMEKYKKDLEGRTRAMQELYRKHGYNPASGCLPVFIQLPIFVGLYRALMVDVELRDAPLLTHAIRWCSNLAAPDMLFDWCSFMPGFITQGTGIFGLGPYFNLLPILTVFLFLWQQKKMMPPPTDDQQAMQQKMMKYMMYFMGILFFKVASGLCVYFIASTLWGIGERKFLPKKKPEGVPEKSPRSRWLSLFGSNGDEKTTRRRKERGRK